MFKILAAAIPAPPVEIRPPVPPKPMDVDPPEPVPEPAPEPPRHFDDRMNEAGLDIHSRNDRENFRRENNRVVDEVHVNQDVVDEHEMRLR